MEFKKHHAVHLLTENKDVDAFDLFSNTVPTFNRRHETELVANGFVRKFLDTIRFDDIADIVVQHLFNHEVSFLHNPTCSKPEYVHITNYSYNYNYHVDNTSSTTKSTNNTITDNCNCHSETATHSINTYSSHTNIKHPHRSFFSQPIRIHFKIDKDSENQEDTDVYSSSVALVPFLSDILQDHGEIESVLHCNMSKHTSKQKQKNKNENENEDKNEKAIASKNESNLTFKLEFCLIEGDNGQGVFKDGGYLLHFGLICIPKEIFQSKMNINAFVKHFEKKRHNLAGIHTLNGNLFAYRLGKKQNNTNTNSNINSNNVNNRLERPKRVECRGHYLSFLGYVHDHYYSCYECGSKRLNSTSFYIDNYCWKTNDTMQLCVDYSYNCHDNTDDHDTDAVSKEKKISSKGSLYFIKNGNILGKDDNKGKFQLDFQENYYMIALASHVPIHTKQNGGFVIQVSKV